MGNTILAQPERTAVPPAVNDAAERLLRVLPPMFKHLMAEVRVEMAPAFHIGETQFGVVHALYHRDFTLSELAERLHVSAPTVSRMIDTLVDRGYVDRHPDATDRRKIWLRLTADGHAVAREMEVCFHQAVARFLQPLAEPDLAALVAACAALEGLLAGATAKESKQHPIREDQN